MGIQSLLPSLKSIVRTKHIGEAYGGKKVAVDSYCWLHRGAYSCSVELVEGIPTDKFVTSFMKRACMLRRCGVEAVYVFDGGRMPGKANEEAERKRTRTEAKDRARKHRRAGNLTAANEQYQRAVDVSPEMALAVIEELKKNGFECIVAPYEADAQMAYLIRNEFVHGVVTEDSDLVPHKCASVFFKMDNEGVGQEIRYDDIAQNKDLSFVGFTPDQFLEMCVMSGCDYLPSLPGVGIKKAHTLMRRLKKYEVALRSLRFEGTSVSKNYELGFKDALNVFKHQWVFCPVRRDMVFLSDALPKGGANGVKTTTTENTCAETKLSDADVVRLIGVKHPVESARGVADGVLHPMSLELYCALPTTGAPRSNTNLYATDSSKPNGHTPNVARFFNQQGGGSKKSRPLSANDAVVDLSTGGSIWVGSGMRANTSAEGNTHTPNSFGVSSLPFDSENLKPKTDPPREKEKWVTPPDHTVGTPGKRAFYALLRASPLKKPLRNESNGLKKKKMDENGNDDVADEVELDAMADLDSENEKLSKLSPAKQHPFHLPASTSRYFSGVGKGVTGVTEPGAMMNSKNTPGHLSESSAPEDTDATTASEKSAKSCDLLNSFAFQKQKTLTPQKQTKPLFENFAYGWK